jgi:glycosyltransferase involved in cell wall biosynthesis
VPPTSANCCAVIPCLNEAAVIGTLVESLRQQLPTVLVVDDGSTDGTAAIAAAAGASVLRHEAPGGKGAALATAWDWAGNHGFTWILMLDGDGQHATEDVPAFLAEAARGPATLIVGNRMEITGAMPWLRRWANRWLSARLSELAGVELPDSQCGFRLAHLPTLKALALRTRHFEIESEMCVAFARAGQRLAFVPVQARYAGECSKISPLRDYWRWWRWYQATRGGAVWEAPTLATTNLEVRELAELSPRREARP